MAVREERTVTYICDRCHAESTDRGKANADLTIAAWLPGKLIFPEEVKMWLCDQCTTSLRTWLRTPLFGPFG